MPTPCARRRASPNAASRAEEHTLRLELKLIADIGIVGVPNAGKSTFLAATTKARPKIGAYPFTTLEPNLGVAVLDEETTLILADIPGLIEGAHQGVGLGYDFLRHIQRTRVLIHLLDGMAEDPLLDFVQINSELALFDPDLARKPQIVALNKMDLDDVQARWPKIQTELKKLIKRQSLNIDAEPFAISAAAGKDVRPLALPCSASCSRKPHRQPARQKCPFTGLKATPRRSPSPRPRMAGGCAARPSSGPPA